MSSYTSRPPKSVRTARRAWDYFTAKYPDRKIKALIYSPNCRGERAWIADWDFTPAQIDHAMNCWGSMYSTDWMQATAPAYQINRFH